MAVKGLRSLTRLVGLAPERPAAAVGTVGFMRPSPGVYQN
jgi:hypothetical protein